MDSVLTFLKENGINFLAVAVLILFLYPRIRLITNKNVASISADDAAALIRTEKNLVILDVRTVEEFKSGHIQGAKNIPLGEIARRKKELEKYRGKPLLVYCASGRRSLRAVSILVKNKYGPIYNINRGLTSWNAGLKR